MANNDRKTIKIKIVYFLLTLCSCNLYAQLIHTNTPATDILYIRGAVNFSDDIISLSWIEESANSQSIHNIGFSSSSDMGVSWSNEPLLSYGNEYSMSDPQLKIDSNDNLYLSCIATSMDSIHLLLYKSLDDGNSWSTNKIISSLASELLIKKPRIAIKNDGSVFMSYLVFEGGDSNVFYTASFDEGVVWTNPLSITATGNECTGNSIGVSGAKVILTYSSFDKVYMTTSDDGLNFSAPTVVMEDLDIIPTTELVCSENNQYVALFIQDESIMSNQYYLRSNNSGEEWSDIIEVSDRGNLANGVFDSNFNFTMVRYGFTSSDVYTCGALLYELEGTTITDTIPFSTTLGSESIDFDIYGQQHIFIDNLGLIHAFWITATFNGNWLRHTYWIPEFHNPDPDHVLDPNVKQLKIGPNPVNGSLEVYLPKNVGICEFNLVNSIGERILSKNNISEEFVISFANYPEGMYYLNCNCDEGNRFMNKIIKQGKVE